MARDLPGFYYDEDKKKYFKILLNHAAPKGSKYSREGVSKERDGVKKRKEAEDTKRRHIEARIQHARILRHPHGSPLALDRETGGLSASSRLDVLHSAWAHGLSFVRSLDFYPCTGPRTPWHTPETYPMFQQRVTAVLKDEATGSVIVGSTATNHTRGNSVLSWAPGRSSDGTPTFAEDAKRLVTYDGYSEITSLCMTPARMLISTTLGGPNSGGTINMTKLLSPDTFHSGETWPVLDTGVTLRLRPNSAPTASIFDSCANPDLTSSTVVAAATESGVLFLRESQTGYHDWLEDYHETESHVFAVSWLSPSLLAAGCRNGVVWLYDRRSGGKVQRLSHPSAVTHLRKADEFRVVAAGLRNNLHMYDLRFPNSPRLDGELLKHTNPYLSYPGHSNTSRIAIGFDVSASHGLVVAATEDNQVKVFQLWTGKEISPGWGKEKKWDEMIKSLTFIGEGGFGGGMGSGEEGLLIGVGGTVEEWSW